MNFKKQFVDIYLNIFLDIIIILSVVSITHLELEKRFVFYLIFVWLISAFQTKFYSVFRYTNWLKFITQSFSHFTIFSLAYFSYYSFFESKNPINFGLLFIFLTIIFAVKIIVLLIQKYYRAEGNNQKKVILFGNENSAALLNNLFNNRPDLGYQLEGFFSDKMNNSPSFLGDIKEGFAYVINHKIDEVYCDSCQFSSVKLLKIRKFAVENEIALRFIPESKAIFSKDLVLENIGTIPILKPKLLPFEKIETFIIKRAFDILFSLLVLILILSWMLPIIWIIIRIDSKGPLFFKQKRDGRNGKQFYCYKFRSMKINEDADEKSASKNDSRVTKVGAFLRKTSLDELPQFINVLIGDMSVVGPRPHMNTHTKKYIKEVNNYMLRHEVKPGITGLAQISGYRGEVIHKSDIQNRVRLDIFYIENWTFILDLKIIAKTLINVFLKEEKAY